MEGYNHNCKIKQEVTEPENYSNLSELNCKIEREAHEPYLTNNLSATPNICSNIEEHPENTKETVVDLCKQEKSRSSRQLKKASYSEKVQLKSTKQKGIQAVEFVNVTEQKCDSFLIQNEIQVNRKSTKRKSVQRAKFDSNLVLDKTNLKQKANNKRTKSISKIKEIRNKNGKIDVQEKYENIVNEATSQLLKCEENIETTKKEMQKNTLQKITNKPIKTCKAKILNRSTKDSQTKQQKKTKRKDNKTATTKDLKQDKNVATEQGTQKFRQTDEVQEQNMNQANNINKDEILNAQNLEEFDSDSLEDFPTVEPKRPKRRKPELTEEQAAEKERKNIEKRTCTLCGFVFAFRAGLRNHIKSKHTVEKTYFCDICDKGFSVHSTYMAHRRRHLGIKPYLCNTCGKTFVRAVDMNIHMRIHIPSEDKVRDVKCGFCSNVYTSKTNLRKHVLTKHTNPSDWKHDCKVCGKKLYSGTALTHHMRRHNDERAYKCVICGRGFFTKQTMNVHVRTHTASTPFKCDYCPKGYCSNEALQRHLLKVHGIGEQKPVSTPTYFCPVCNEGFRQRARLEQHVELHQTGEEEYPYECEKCHRRYKARHYFTIHMLDRHAIKIDESYFKTFLSTNQQSNANISNLPCNDSAISIDEEYKNFDASIMEPDTVLQENESS